MQPSGSKHAHVGDQASVQVDRSITEEITEPELRCEKLMDSFINADRRDEKCCRKIINNHFGNNNLHESGYTCLIDCHSPLLSKSTHCTWLLLLALHTITSHILL